MYKNEASFVRSLSGRLKQCTITRIESHGTGNGIPDMFVTGHGHDMWLELKNNNKLSVHDKAIKVDWRPGQVGWAYDYYIKHNNNKCTLTLVSVSDGIIVIPMIQVFKDHMVYNPQSISNQEQVNLYRVLVAMSDCSITGNNYLEAINKLCETYYPGIDYDPECLWNPDLLEHEYNSKIFNSSKLDSIITLERTVRNSLIQ